MSSGAILLTRWVLFCLCAWVGLAFRPVRSALSVKYPEGRQRVYALLIGFFLFAPAHAMYYVGLESSNTGVTMVLNTTGPLWTGLLAFLILSERVSGRRWLAIAVGAVGSYVVSMGFAAPDFSSASTWGSLLYLIGVITETLAMVLAIKIIRDSSGPGTLAFEVIGAAVSCAVLPIVLPTKMNLVWAAPTGWTILSLGYLVVVAGLFCFGMWYRYAEKAPISLMVVSLGLQAPIGVLLAFWFRGEPLTFNLLTGTVLILGALTIAAREQTTPLSPEAMQA